MRIQLAKPTDYDRIKELLFATRVITDETFFTREQFERGIRAFGRYYFVAEVDGRVVGSVSGFDDGGIWYGWMMRLAVDESHRRQHIGEGLAQACLQEFQRAGVQVVYAGAHQDNTASRGLVAKLGFKDEDHKLLWRGF